MINTRTIDISMYDCFGHSIFPDLAKGREIEVVRVCVCVVTSSLPWREGRGEGASALHTHTRTHRSTDGGAAGGRTHHASSG